MRWLTGNLADVVFDGHKGQAFSVILIGLVIAGAIVLVVNLTAKPRARPQPEAKWEAVPDEAPAAPAGPAPATAKAAPAKPRPAQKPAPPRRKA